MYTHKIEYTRTSQIISIMKYNRVIKMHIRYKNYLCELDIKRFINNYVK